MSLVASLFSNLLPVKKKTPVFYLDASSFDPDQARRQREAVIYKACNQADTIYEKVRDLMRTSAGVIVIDQGSTDGTQFFAAEAGAVVIQNVPGNSSNDVMRDALRIAKQLSQVVVFEE